MAGSHLRSSTCVPDDCVSTSVERTALARFAAAEGALPARLRRRESAPPSPPGDAPPPGRPPSPPSPGFPPDAPVATGDCDFYEGSTEADFSVSASLPITIEEPCGLSPRACCALAHEEGAYLFFVSVSGCCMLYKDGTLAYPFGLAPPVAASGLDALGRGGVGVVV